MTVELLVNVTPQETRVALVENGVLRGFLQSRSPVESGQVSNGHGRRSWGRPSSAGSSKAT